MDIRTFEKNGAVWVKSGTGGISTFDSVNPRLKGTDWWKIPANTKIPDGLKITKNHTDHALRITHYRIEPRFDMLLGHMVHLLQQLSKSAIKLDSQQIKER